MADNIELCREASTSEKAHPVADSIRKSLTIVISNSRTGKLPTIYEVPQTIRHGNEDAYEPKIVSIGPYHKGKERLQGMEEHKWRYLHSILNRNTELQLEDYVKAMEELKDEARSCYSDNVDVEMRNKFVEMMLLDGCFIVQLFLNEKQIRAAMQNAGEEKRKPNKEQPQKAEEAVLNLIEVDPIFGMLWPLPIIRYDMLLLENQIPFSVLESIYKMASPGNGSLAKVALDFFDEVMITRNKEIQIKDSYHHLLHLCHSHSIPTQTQSNELKSIPNNEPNPTAKSFVNILKNPLKLLPCSNKPQDTTNNQSPPWMVPGAVELQLAGVKLKRNEKWSSILDVRFTDGELKIPPLLIEDYTNTLFRNLVAFEQCYLSAGLNFTTYIIFMDRLVNTSKDVALLHRSRIMDHSLGSDEDVARLFNQLTSGICDDFCNNYLSRLHKDLEKHCNTTWNMWWASLRGDYFSNPWASLSSTAAVILLLLTIAQTIFTIFNISKIPI